MFQWSISTLGSKKLCWVFLRFLQSGLIRKIYRKNIKIPWWYTVLFGMWRALLIPPIIVSSYDVCQQLCVAKHMQYIRASLDHVMNVLKQVIGERLRISLLYYCPLAFSCCGLKYQIDLVNRLLGQLCPADVSQNALEKLPNCTA